MVDDPIAPRSSRIVFWKTANACYNVYAGIQLDLYFCTNAVGLFRCMEMALEANLASYRIDRLAPVFSPDCSTLIVAAGCDVLGLSTTTGEEVFKISGHSQPINCIRIACDKYLYTSSKDGKMVVTDGDLHCLRVHLNIGFETDELAKYLYVNYFWLFLFALFNSFQMDKCFAVQVLSTNVITLTRLEYPRLIASRKKS